MKLVLNEMIPCILFNIQGIFWGNMKMVNYFYFTSYSIFFIFLIFFLGVLFCFFVSKKTCLTYGFKYRQNILFWFSTFYSVVVLSLCIYGNFNIFFYISVLMVIPYFAIRNSTYTERLKWFYCITYCYYYCRL